MVQIVIRIVINAVALWVAAYIVPGVNISDSVPQLLLAAVVFGLVNAFVKPIVQLLSCPITLLTLGLFTLVINALMLMLTGWLTQGAITTEGFWFALLAGLVISIVNTILSAVLLENK
jgi:putative membrane protein